MRDQARALLEWHGISQFCGHCGGKTVPMEAGLRKQCSNELCKKRIYPRIDPVWLSLPLFIYSMQCFNIVDSILNAFECLFDFSDSSFLGTGCHYVSN